MKRREGNPRLVLVPSPFQGHINPMLQLGATLHSQGFSITIIHTQFNSPNASNYPHFSFVSIQDGLTDDEISSPDKTTLVFVINAKCEAAFQGCLSQLLQEQETLGDIACIIYDELSYFSAAPAHDLNVPSIIFRTSNVITFLVRGTMFQYWQEGRIPLADPLSEEPILEYPHLRLKDLPISSFAPIEVFFELLTKVRNVRRSSAIIYNTMNFLEGPSLEQLQYQCPVPVFAIGPLHKAAPISSCSFLEEDANCMAWLDKQTPNSVIYISLGSLASTNEKELAEMAWGLANSKQPFLWVVRPGSLQGSDGIEYLPEGFKDIVGERGCIVKWAPQKEVLAHVAVGGFLSHCGWNSFLESVCEGVPIICKPSFGDQKVTARYVSHVWRIGLQLENVLERGEMERVVRRLMVDKEGEEMRQRAMDLKEKAQICIGEGGSSYQSLKQLVKLIKSF